MTELITITEEERAAIVKPASDLLTIARAFQCTTAALYEDGANRLKLIKAAQKKLADKKRGVIDPINAALKAARDLFRSPEDELTEAEGLYKRSMTGYADEQERIRQEEQRRLDAAADRERQRQLEIAQRAEAQAAAARAAGDTAKAEKLEQKAEARHETAAAVVAPIAQREAPRVAGIATRENWSAVVTDFKALVQAVAAGTVPLMALEPNTKFLNNQAKAMKRELSYPGVSAARETVMAAGSK